MILKYSEALKKSSNPDWFSTMYKPEDLASDDEVDEINKLILEVGEDKLFDYFEIKEDMTLQKEYIEDLIDYLNEFKM